MLGRLEPAAVIDQIRRARVVVCPSLIEPFSRTTVEALALGRPVIVTETTGAAQWVGSTGAGSIVPPNNPGELASAIRAWTTRKCPSGFSTIIISQLTAARAAEDWVPRSQLRLRQETRRLRIDSRRDLLYFAGLSSSMTPSPKRKKLLVFWSATDFPVCRDTIATHPDYDVEIVSSLGQAHEQASYRRLLRLRKAVDAGEYDLVLANNIMRSPFPGNKGPATTASLALRLLTYQRLRLDTWWAPWIVRGGKSKTPLAIIDARDSHYIFPWDLPLLQAARFYFKRDLMFWPMRALQPLENYHTEKKIRPYLEKIQPMSLGLDESRFATASRLMKERDIDLFISGADNPLRRLVREKCERLSGRFHVHIHKGLLPIEEYREMLQRVKLAVCVESLGGETWRQYEVASAGAVPFMSWPYTQVADPLVPDVHAIYFSYIADHFERVAAAALADPARLQLISDAARQFVLAKKGRRNLINHVVETTLSAAR